MKSIKHSKYKNTGLLFELLVRQITDDTINSKTSPALNIIQKYFTNTELMKEYLLYQTLRNTTNLSEVKSDILISSVVSSYDRLDRKKLKESKYNLVKEIKSHYSEEQFFKTNVPSYRLNACIYSLFETVNAVGDVNPTDVLLIKSNLLEHISSKPTEDEVITEWKSLDRGEQNLSLKIMVETFNKTYSSFDSNQKAILNEYIMCVTTPNTMRPTLNRVLLEVKQEMVSEYNKITDVVTKVKLKEVINNIQPLRKGDSITEDHVTDTLYVCEILNELKSANKG